MQFCREKVKADCEELLGRFQQTDSVRFESFSAVWRSMKFSQVFYGTLGAEKKAFSREVLDTACSFFLPPFTFQIRVGGLYLLYSLYLSQSATPPQQIRLALKDWEHVKQFEHDAVEAQHLDTVYVLRQLLLHKAFHFTATPRLLSYQKKRKARRLPDCEAFVERPTRPQQLVSGDLLEELSNVQQHYERLKASICAAPDQPDPSLTLTRGDLVPRLQDAVLEFHRGQRLEAAPREDDDDESGGEGTSAQLECSRRAELLASIKSKSYGQAVEVSKSRRHRQVELGLASDSETAAASSSHRTHRMSLKARTNKNVQITGELKQETVKQTKLWCLTKLDSAPEDVPRKFPKFKW
ncbi:snRNA-activating protein complex subunit 1b [Myripristis murdjan]|uniref:Small nuclear RNA activating complex, polypeptide 1b n=1 Tax=Myripristis murdjan TaxID=586833 RepID=A0A667XQT5_9TELE|nr:snRNA-activating protein complex subunit 1 [Myripristis murdjan]